MNDTNRTHMGGVVGVHGRGRGESYKEPHQNVNISLLWRAGSGEKEGEKLRHFFFDLENFKCEGRLVAQ